MNIITLITILSFSSSLVYCQNDILIFKIRNKEINRYWKGSTIAFQLWDKQHKLVNYDIQNITYAYPYLYSCCAKLCTV